MTRRSVAQRARELTTGSMVPLEVAYSIQVEDARALERQLHFRFRGRRMTGGGREFFAVPAREVIAEIERIAAKVSRKWAREAADAEMAAYKVSVGANRLETWIAVAAMVAYPASAALMILGAWKVAGLMPGGWLLTAMAVAVFVSLAAAGVTSVWVNHWLTRRFFEPRFGGGVRQKMEELRRRYPLADG
jgi:hypothetical protein